MTTTISGDAGIGFPGGGSYSDARVLAAPNGFLHLPGGLLWQWGTKSYSNDGPEPITFTKPFTSAVYTIQVSGTQEGGNPNAITGITLTGFNYDRADAVDGTCTIYYQAIGV